MARKKDRQFLIRVRFPADLTAAQARREVRTLVNHEANWMSHLNTGDVRIAAIGPVPAPPKAPARTYWGQTIHDAAELAEYYADDGALLTAADRLRRVADKLEKRAKECGVFTTGLQE